MKKDFFGRRGGGVPLLRKTAYEFYLFTEKIDTIGKIRQLIQETRIIHTGEVYIINHFFFLNALHVL